MPRSPRRSRGVGRGDPNHRRLADSRHRAQAAARREPTGVYRKGPDYVANKSRTNTTRGLRDEARISSNGPEFCRQSRQLSGAPIDRRASGCNK
ncbi:unnamed protein product, partial [Iphiclides podalirius]